MAYSPKDGEEIADIGARPVLIGRKYLATMLDLSLRHLDRMRDAGQIPRPIRLGNLVRWNRATIDAWIAEGCPDCRTKQRASPR